MDLSNPRQIAEVLDTEKANIIVSAGDYTAADKAESDQQLYDVVKHITVKTICEGAAVNSEKVIYISIDYVLDSNNETPLKETCTTDPNKYLLIKQIAWKASFASIWCCLYNPSYSLGLRS